MEFYYHLKRCRSLRRHARLFLPVVMDMFSLEILDISVHRYRKESGYSADTIKKRLAEIGVRIVRNQSRDPGYFEVAPGYRGLDPDKHPNIRLRNQDEPPPGPDGSSPRRKPNKNQKREVSKEASKPDVVNLKETTDRNRCKPTDEACPQVPIRKQHDSEPESARKETARQSETEKKPFYIKVSRENKQTGKTRGTSTNAHARERPPSPRPIPPNFAWTPTLDRWAREKHPQVPLPRMKGFLSEVFIPQNLAKDYRYVDHERAFMVWTAREFQNPRGWFAKKRQAKRLGYRGNMSREELVASRREGLAIFSELVKKSNACA